MSQKKFRDKNQLYIVEGEKLVKELMGGKAGTGHRIKLLFASGDWIGQNHMDVSKSGIEAIEAAPAEIKKVSNLVTPSQVLALVTMPHPQFNEDEIADAPVLAFESIRIREIWGPSSERQTGLASHM